MIAWAAATRKPSGELSRRHLAASFSRWFSTCRRPAALQLADPDHRQPPGTAAAAGSSACPTRCATPGRKGIPASPCRVIYNLPDLSRFHAADRSCFAHRPEHRQQSCRHRHRDHNFALKGHENHLSVPWRCFPGFNASCSSPRRDSSETYQRLRKSSAWPGISISRWRTCRDCTGQWSCSFLRL